MLRKNKKRERKSGVNKNNSPKNKKRESNKVKLPFSKATILSVIAFLLASGGWGGYQIVKDNPKYGVFFDSRAHKVTQVIDGDTFVIDGEIRIRLIGVDAPETRECYGEEATMFLRKLLKGKKIYLEKDISGTDDFGRLLRYAILKNDNPEENNILVNDLLIRSGYAMDYKSSPDNRYRDLFSSSRNAARRAELGIWKECSEESFNKLSERDRRSTVRIQENTEPINKMCVIKGNISTQGHGRTYFLPSCGNYSRVHVDPALGEKYFCTEKEAEAEGFVISGNCLGS